MSTLVLLYSFVIFREKRYGFQNKTYKKTVRFKNVSVTIQTVKQTHCWEERWRRAPAVRFNQHAGAGGTEGRDVIREPKTRVPHSLLPGVGITLSVSTFSDWPSLNGL